MKEFVVYNQYHLLICLPASVIAGSHVCEGWVMTEALYTFELGVLRWVMTEALYHFQLGVLVCTHAYV